MHEVGPAQRFLEVQIERLRRLPRPMRIVFPEGDDPRVRAAAERLAREGLIEPLLIGRDRGDGGVRCLDPETDPATARYAALYYERRKARGVSEREAARIARRPLNFAALMVAAGDADGTVGGAANSTAETVRAALHAIGPAPGVRTVSGFFVMALPRSDCGARGLFVFADCAVVVDPSAHELAEIALAAAGSVRTLLEAEPKVALLACAPEAVQDDEQAAKVARALEELGRRGTGFARLCAGDAGEAVEAGANALIFPNLNAGNIGYKLVERLAGAAAIGPFLQGLAKPANDLSRACSAEDVYAVAIVTALQAAGVFPGRQGP
ncbi:MAG: phosphate acyltransferase [Bryobacterales bacterium]|nr:phosphate acyltransferase [Bryobacteraceae bacterium]MDW8128993.1 phosphate acyltransferase [Bryobacterales bacterium]